MKEYIRQYKTVISIIANITWRITRNHKSSICLVNYEKKGY
jgi:hypothetical protein